MLLPFYTMQLSFPKQAPLLSKRGLFYFALFFAVILNVSSIIVIIRTKKKMR